MNAAQFNTIVSLLKKRLYGPLSADEKVLLEQWLAESGENQEMLQRLDDPAVVAEELAVIAGAGESVYARIKQQLPELAATLPESSVTPRIHFLRRSWVKYAAAVILLLGIGTWWWLSRDTKPAPQQVVSVTKDVIVPGSSGAILTLADGSQIVLDSIGNGKLTVQNGSEVTMENGRLIYDPAKESNTAIVYNTMSTPRGRQFEVTLPDGTHVWLNAASSIRYPTAFTGINRTVELNGEAYFEVKKQAKQPFIVKAGNKATIEVLGTHFNVNAYENEASLNTTLLEGTVKVNGTTIQPGQQAQIDRSASSQNPTVPSQHVRVINDASLDNVMAWKNGFINFEGAAFSTIMRQLERWYDIQIVYDNNIIPTTRLAGKMTRGVSLDGLLKNLEALGVHFRLDGRKLIILQ